MVAFWWTLAKAVCPMVEPLLFARGDKIGD